MKPLTAATTTKVLHSTYEHVLRGLPGTPTAAELADRYLAKYGNVETAIDKLINWQAAKCSASGFLTGLGGLVTLPIAVPADLAATYYVTIRMIAAIAHLRGFDLEAEATRTTVFLCLVGDSAVEVLHKAGLDIGTKIAKSLLKRLPEQTLQRIDKAVGAKLAVKVGESGMTRLGRLAPVAGALVGAAINGAGCRLIGSTAKVRLAAAKTAD